MVPVSQWISLNQYASTFYVFISFIFPQHYFTLNRGTEAQKQHSKIVGQLFLKQNLATKQAKCYWL